MNKQKSYLGLKCQNFDKYGKKRIYFATINLKSPKTTVEGYVWEHVQSFDKIFDNQLLGETECKN